VPAVTATVKVATLSVQIVWFTGRFALSVVGWLTVTTTVLAGDVQVPGPVIAVLNNTLEIAPAGSCHISCGAVVVNGNCIPILVKFTVVPFITVVFGGRPEYELTVAR
jgi:hypothetical protein